MVQLSRIAHLTLQQMSEPDDGVHRRTDLVAHIGEERRLRAAGGFSRIACCLQRLFGSPAHDDAPQIVPDQLQLAHVRFVVIVGLVADPQQHANQAALEHRHRHVALQGEMAGREARLAGFGWKCVVNQRPPATHGIGPQARR